MRAIETPTLVPFCVVSDTGDNLLRAFRQSLLFASVSTLNLTSRIESADPRQVVASAAPFVLQVEVAVGEVRIVLYGVDHFFKWLTLTPLTIRVFSIITSFISILLSFRNESVW